MATESYLLVQEEAQTIIRLFTIIDRLLEKDEAYADLGLTQAAVSNQFTRFSRWALDTNALLPRKHPDSLTAQLQKIPRAWDIVYEPLIILKEILEDSKRTFPHLPMFHAKTNKYA